ncbi:DUF4177 domain-containing protein [Rubripirellula sp.]|nr:DUF4177 domain-containing protein [Rubripirellula sp.]
MKLSHTLLICACLVFAGMNFSNAVTPAPAPQQQVQKWEYKTLEIGKYSSFFREGDGTIQDIQNLRPDWMKALGDQGWELVTYTEYLTTNAAAVGDFKRIYNFKRPKN